jgi:hypothetical protein
MDGSRFIAYLLLALGLIAAIISVRTYMQSRSGTQDRKPEVRGALAVTVTLFVLAGGFALAKGSGGRILLGLIVAVLATFALVIGRWQKR